MNRCNLIKTKIAIKPLSLYATQKIVQPSSNIQQCFHAEVQPPREDDDDITVVTDNRTVTRPSNIHQANSLQSKEKLVPSDYAIADSGASDHFFIVEAEVNNIRPTTSPISITQPDGTVSKSTHMCDIDLPSLPPAACKNGHIVPEFSKASLISIRRIVDAGCQVLFTMHEVRVLHHGRCVLTGKRHPATGLWLLPLSKKPMQPSFDIITPTAQPITAAAHNAYTMPTKQQALKYIHQCLFSPPIPTLLRAIENNQLKSFPHIQRTKDVRRHLAASPATAKGHMKKPRAGLRSTRKKPPKPSKYNLSSPSIGIGQAPKSYTTTGMSRRRLQGIVAHQLEQDRASNPPEPQQPTTSPTIIPPDPAETEQQEREEMEQPEQDDKSLNVFCYAALADKIEGTMYTDVTGALPHRSLEGNLYYLIAYIHDMNAILARPIKSTKSEDIIGAFEEIFQYLKDRGYSPKLNVTDNQAASQIKQFLSENDCQWQFVEPHNHRVNAAERAIQTFKNHFISGLCCTDSEFPLQLWDQLTEQAEITLNLLRTSRRDPSKSAYEDLHGEPFDFNRTPLAPPGTRAVVYDHPSSRASWAPRGSDAWYVGPAKDHYRNYRFFVVDTNAYRTSASCKFFPQHCQHYTPTPIEHATEVADELITTAEALPKRQRFAILSTIAKALQKIIRLRQPTTEGAKSNSEGGPTTPELAEIEGGNQVIRPNNPAITTSTNPTAPRIHRSKPRTHQRHTRNNTPGTLPKPTTQLPEQVPRRSQRTRQPTQVAFEEIQPIPSTPPHTRVQQHRIISQDALLAYCGATMMETHTKNLWRPTQLEHAPTEDIMYYCAPVTHPITGKAMRKYAEVIKCEELRETWETAFGKEFGGLAQGDDRTGQKGTDTVIILDHDQIKNIPADRVVTYASIATDYREQKDDPNRVRITAGGNLINYPGELTTRTADLQTTKIMWNSVVSTPGARYCCFDISSFYLGTPLDRYEYMKIPLRTFPEHVKQQYNLNEMAYKGQVYLEIRRSIWGLPQAGILSNRLLKERLAPHGYYECEHTPGLWRHETRPIAFTLVVDDFGIKYTNKADAEHLYNCIAEHYKVKADWEGKLYCGITLDWDYEKRTVTLSMPGYVKKMLINFNHPEPKKPQDSPHPAPPRKFGTAAQDPIDEDTSAPLNPVQKRRIQQIVGAGLYYGRAVDNTILVALGSLASEQANPTESTEQRANQLLDYLTTHPDAKIQFRASDMILNIHSDASYLSEPRARSRIAGVHFLGSIPKDHKPIIINGFVHVVSNILKCVVASAAEAELGGLFHNCKEAKVLRLTLEELGHPQPPTPVHCDNATATGIANDTVKKHRSRSMEKNYFWVTDQVKRKQFDVRWHPGKENLADYPSKNHDASHHREVRPWMLHIESISPITLPRAQKPSTLRGCVGTLEDGYLRHAPLPRIPKRKRTGSRNDSRTSP